MGCKCSCFDKVDEPPVFTDLVSVRTEEPIEQPVPVRKDSEQRPIADPVSDQFIDEDQLIKSLIIVPTASNGVIDIEVLDAHAFSDSFIQQRQRVIDNRTYRSIIESWHPTTLEQLTDFIKSLSNNKPLIDSHWIIFYWIACNIAYDTVSFFNKNYEDQSAEGVFQNRKGVCAGYGNLYKYLCDQLKLTCEIVTGYSKGYGFDSHGGVPAETDHAWNAVHIDQHWYLVESTWGAGHLTNEKRFKRQLNSYYFFPQPNEMIYHHLPENERWQLLRTPIQMQQYLQMPKIHPSYFLLNLDLLNPRYQSFVDLLPKKSYALVLIRTPPDVHLVASLKLHESEIEGGHQIQFDRQNQLYRCYFAPNTIGHHQITVFGKRGETDIGHYDACLDLTLDVQHLLAKPISFPKTWKKFFDLDMHIISPIGTHLIKVHHGMTHAEVLIRTPDTVELLGRLTHANGEDVEGGHEVFYDRREGIWRCRFAPHIDGLLDASILAKKKSDTGHYTSAITFKIDTKHLPSPPLSYPKTWASFFDLGMKIISPIGTHLIKLHHGETHVEVLIQTPDTVELLGRLTYANGKEVEGGHEVFYDRREGIWRCRFAPHIDGLLDASILAKKKSDSGHYTSAVTFKIDAKDVPTPPLSYPKTWQHFYDLGLKIEAPKDRAVAVWPVNAAFSEIRLFAPDDVELSCSMEFNGKEQANCTLSQYDHQKRHWQLLFAPQHTGQHKLTVFARRQSNAQSTSHSVVQFDLHVTKLRQVIRFPTTYAEFERNKCQIYDPIRGTLKKGTIVPMHCYVPQAKEVRVQVDSNWVETKGYENSILNTEITVGSTDVIIYGRFGQNTSFDGLVRYSVE